MDMIYYARTLTTNKIKKIPRLSDEAVYELFKRVTSLKVISILFIIFVPEDLIQSYILQRSRVQVILPKS